MTWLHFPIGVVFLLITTQCSKGLEEPPVSSKSSSQVVAASSASGGLFFSAPEEWIEETPSSSMRQAQYRLPRAENDLEDGELVVFHFPGQGGSVQANISRWVKQFSRDDGTPAGDSAKITSQDANGITLTLVEVAGTYRPSSGPMMQSGSPKPGYLMLAVIAETTSGPWFFKLTGPQGTIEKWRKDFLIFLNTIQHRP